MYSNTWRTQAGPIIVYSLKMDQQNDSTPGLWCLVLYRASLQHTARGWPKPTGKNIRHFSHSLKTQSKNKAGYGSLRVKMWVFKPVFRNLQNYSTYLCWKLCSRWGKRAGKTERIKGLLDPLHQPPYETDRRRERNRNRMMDETH